MVDRPLVGHTLYVMGKAALHALTTASAVELAQLNIRVNAVCPGYNLFQPSESEDSIKKNRGEVPLGAVEGKPMDIADAVLYLSRAAYVTGVLLNVDGGLRLSRP